MAKLLYLKASPRTERSHSVAVADSFIKAYQETHPGDEVQTEDLFQKDLPAFDELAVNARYNVMNGKDPDDQQKNRWRQVMQEVEEFKAADKYVIAVPMWNFGIPYRLKQYFDVIVQPGQTFTFDPNKGYQGLVTGKPMLVTYARGGEYAEGSDTAAFDMQKKYMDLILGFVGFKNVSHIVVEPTMAGGPEASQQKRDEAIVKAQEMAKKF